MPAPVPGADPVAEAPATAPAEAAAQEAAALDVTDDRAVEAARRALFERVRAYVEELSEGGRYDCCVKVPCSHCALMAGGCRCGEGARRGEPVCEECAYLWTRGQGDEPGAGNPRDCRKTGHACVPR